MRHIWAVLAMPSRSHGKPQASRDQRGLEELTHQLRQLCLCPLGVVQRVQPLMGPDGLSLVFEHGSAPPPYSHSDFPICSLSGNRMAIFKWNRTGSLLLLCLHATELSDVNMFIIELASKVLAASFLRSKQGHGVEQNGKEKMPLWSQLLEWDG